MPPRTTRTAAALAAILAAGLAALAFKTDGHHRHRTLAAHTPAEIRTVTIRRTIHIVRHVPGPAGPGSSGARGRGACEASSCQHPRERLAQERYDAAAARAVATRASGSHGASVGASSSGAGALTTRASGSHGAGSANGAPTGLPSQPAPAGPTAVLPRPQGNPVTTRTSGGGHGGGDGGAGGDGNGGDNYGAGARPDQIGSPWGC